MPRSIFTIGCKIQIPSNRQAECSTELLQLGQGEVAQLGVKPSDIADDEEVNCQLVFALAASGVKNFTRISGPSTCSRLAKRIEQR